MNWQRFREKVNALRSAAVLQPLLGIVDSFAPPVRAWVLTLFHGAVVRAAVVLVLKVCLVRAAVGA